MMVYATSNKWQNDLSALKAIDTDDDEIIMRTVDKRN